MTKQVCKTREVDWIRQLHSKTQREAIEWLKDNLDPNDVLDYENRPDYPNDEWSYDYTLTGFIRKF